MLSQKSFSVILLILVLSVFGELNIAFGASGNWIEIVTLTGSGGIGSTKTFVVDRVDWRIRWEFEPGNGSERVAFLVYVFQTTGIKGSVPWIDSIQHFGTEETTGILNIYNQSGYFYMDVLTGNIENYSMVIEQNLDSIPEFSSWIILPFFLICILSLILFKRKMYTTDHKNAQEIMN